MTPAAKTVPRAKGLNCPNCGGSLGLRGFAHTLTAVCPQCLAIIDAQDPNLKILQTYQAKTRLTLLVPLGSRGQWQGTPYEVIGFQQRTIQVDGVAYSWDEYLLFNPYKGFRYLTHYMGHWNDVRTLRALPEEQAGFGRPKALYGGETYTHFQSAQAETTYVLGEFPWQVRRGETVTAKDYVAPPKMLSAEVTKDETVWSQGVYVSGAEVWKAFKLPNAPPSPSGVYSDQPNPYAGQVKRYWSMYWLFFLLCLAGIALLHVIARNSEVFSQRYAFQPGVAGEQSFVTPVFELKGRAANLEVKTQANVSNNWAYFNFALINEETGEGLDFGREVSYYSGSDSDGSWTEGSRGDKVTLPPVPPGRYYLRVEPEGQAGAAPVSYEITIRHDVPQTGLLWVSIFLLIVPPVWVTIRAWSFEHQRNQESDYSTTGSGGGDSDSGDDE